MRVVRKIRFPRSCSLKQPFLNSVLQNLKILWDNLNIKKLLFYIIRGKKIYLNNNH